MTPAPEVGGLTSGVKTPCSTVAESSVGTAAVIWAALEGREVPLYKKRFWECPRPAELASFSVLAVSALALSRASNPAPNSFRPALG